MTNTFQVYAFGMCSNKADEQTTNNKCSPGCKNRCAEIWFTLAFLLTFAFELVRFWVIERSRHPIVQTFKTSLLWSVPGICQLFCENVKIFEFLICFYISIAGFVVGIKYFADWIYTCHKIMEVFEYLNMYSSSKDREEDYSDNGILDANLDNQENTQQDESSSATVINSI